MQPGMKAVVAVLVVALIAVIGLIVISQGNSAQKPAPTVTATPEQKPEATAELAQGDDAAQDTMYEGALAGLTEEEIAKMALAEEESSERQSDIGAEDSVD